LSTHTHSSSATVVEIEVVDVAVVGDAAVEIFIRICAYSNKI
jgi:hypothetical protein